MWTVQWSDGPTVPTMRGHVDRVATALRVPHADVDGLRYARVAQDLALLALAVQYRLDHPHAELRTGIIEGAVHPDVEYP